MMTLRQPPSHEDGLRTMELGVVSPSSLLSPLPARATLAGARRAFGGVTWQHGGMLLALCVIWAVSGATHDVLWAWESGLLASWLLHQVGGNSACMVIIATVMAAPLIVVGNLGPQSGWRRVAALALTIAAVAPLAAVLRLTWMVQVVGRPFDESTALNQLISFWFRYAQLAGLVTVVAEFHRRETRSLQAMHQAEIDRLALDREMAEARMQVLQAQIEPHFLFNTLANVRRLYQMDLVAGRAMLDNLMRYLEVALPRMRETRSTVGREITLIEAYLNVQAIRMGRRLVFEIDVPEELHALDVPPMMLLTLVENAIKHGLNPMPEGGVIRIGGRSEGTRLHLQVFDDGRGFHATSGGGTGLANIRARLAAMHAGAASLTLVKNAHRGVTSMLELPVLEGRYASS